MTNEYQTFIKTKCLDQEFCNFKFDLIYKNYGYFIIMNGKKIFHYIMCNFIDTDSKSHLMSEYLFRYRSYLCMDQDTLAFNVESSNANESEVINAEFINH
ncbi:MAG: hypothetical protein ACI86M_001327 [Saprospiraceae bacterium]|jgi:hypothetical protein